jgi:7-cyano-7-deazaguanine synthase
MDSAVVLAMARERGYAVHALSVRYGQRHTSELDAAANVAAALGVVAHKTVAVDLRALGGSALTDDAIAVPTDADGHVIGQDEVLEAADIFCGVNAVDYSGYPDCRPEFVAAFERLANLATRAGVEGAGIRIHAPLMRLSKADIVREGLRLGVDFSRTVSCYQADAHGRACGHCDACRLRAEGFADAGAPDPTRYAD